MLKIFHKKDYLLKILKKIEKNRDNKKGFNLIIYGKRDSVDMQILDRSVVLNYFEVEYNKKYGFDILITFNDRKLDNQYYFEQFKSNKYFSLFNFLSKDGNENYYLDCEGDKNKVEMISLDILNNVFKNDIKTARIDIVW